MTDLLLNHQHNDLTRSDPNHLGHVANAAASTHVFEDYRSRKAENTIIRQDRGLELFGQFLTQAGMPVVDLATNPDSWRGVTWGLVAAFQKWLLTEGFAVSSVNLHVTTVKVYAGLAVKANVIDTQTHALIKSVEGYSRKEGKRINEQREVTRIGAKKEKSITLNAEQIARLKQQPNTPQGRRDAVIMCILLDHGLRCGELALLEVEHFDLVQGVMVFYRPKVDKEQTHQLSHDTRLALQRYLMTTGPTSGALLQTTRKGGAITGQGMSERLITKRVSYLGKRIGAEGLSAHDCRHTWATIAARSGTPLDRLMEAGGWSSMAMPMRYIEACRVANEGVKLSEIER